MSGARGVRGQSSAIREEAMPPRTPLLALLLLFLATATGSAQPACTPQLQNSVACFSGAVNLQATDLLSGMQASGPQRNPQSVGVTPAQILNGHFNASLGTLGTTGAVTAGSGSSSLALVPGTLPQFQMNGYTVMSFPLSALGGGDTYTFIGRNAGNGQTAASGALDMVAVGDSAGASLTTGSEDTFIGWGAGRNCTTCNFNTAIGANSQGLGITTAGGNVSVGTDSLRNAVNPFSETAIGNNTLRNDTGHSNTVVGTNSAWGYNGSTDTPTNFLDIVVVGAGSLTNLNAGTVSFDVIVGAVSGTGIVGGAGNTLVGTGVGNGLTTESNDTFVGYQAGHLATGGGETGIGSGSMSNALGSSNSTAVGLNSLQNDTGTNNVVMGAGALISSSGTPSAASGMVVIGQGAVNNANPGALLDGVVIGGNSGQALTGATGPVLIGFGAGNALTNQAGVTAVGFQAAGTLTAGQTTAVGYQSMALATGASNSTAVGFQTLKYDGGNSNTVMGINAGQSSVATPSTMVNMVIIGASAVDGTNPAGLSLGVVIGSAAGRALTATGGTVLIGAGSGAVLTNQGGNTLTGYNTGHVLTAGNNTFNGYTAGLTVTTGHDNTCIGATACATTAQTGNNNIVIGSGKDTLTSSISNEINIGGLIWRTTGTVAVSACGGSPSVDANANSVFGTATMGSGSPTSCTLTWTPFYSTYSHCRVTPETSQAGFGYSYTLGVLTITGSALTGKVDYECDGV